MSLKIKSLLLIFLFTKVVCFSQNIDSLKLALKNAKHDTTRCNILSALSETASDEEWPIYNAQLKVIAQKNIQNVLLRKFYLNHLASALNNEGYLATTHKDFTTAIGYFHNSIRIYKEINNIKSLAGTLSNIGGLYSIQEQNMRAINYYSFALKYYEFLKDSINIGKTSSELGGAYANIGDFSKAINFQFKSLNILEIIGNSKFELSKTYNDIGMLYSSQKDINKAILYYKKSLDLDSINDNMTGVSQAFHNIATAYATIKEYKKAIFFSNKALVINQNLNDKSGQAGSLLNLGIIYMNQKEYSKANSLYSEAFKIYSELNDKEKIGTTLIYSTNLLIAQNEYNKACIFAKKAYDIAIEIGSPLHISDAAYLRKQIYKKQKNYKKAFEMYQLEITMRDSISNQETRKASVKKQMQYEFDKKESEAKAEQEKKDAITLRDKQKQTMITYAIALGLLIALGFGIFIYRSYRQKQKANIIITQQKEEVEHQKHIIEEAQKEISDSINYAKRIQSSFMASKEELDAHLNNYFIVFKPKDVVSGDFYWANSYNNYFYLCTADSTGHGIPGAFMSLLNISLLNEALFSRNLINTSDILNFVRKILILGIKADESGQGGKDGMDCSLMRFDFTNKQLTYSAANNPIWVVRKCNPDKSISESVSDENPKPTFELLELKPDKMPVGKHDKQDVSFTQHQINLQEGDVVYTLTDGFPDQFGGPKGKKFMSKNLRELLLANAHLPMQQQKELLETTFKNWVGNTEQIDDVTLIGIRV